MGGDCAAQDGPPPVTIQLRYRRLAIIICIFVAAMLALVIPISMDLVVIHAFDSSTMHLADQYDVRDDYNSLVSSVVSALSIPKDWLIGSVLPVCFLTFASSRHMQKDQTFWTGAAFMGIDLSIRYLINIGFQATHVQLTQKIQMRINDHDLTANMDALDIMQSYSTNVSNIVPESLVDSDNYINYMTNTVLRNVLAPIALKTTSPKCSPSNKSEDSYDSSQFGTGLVQSYGFPIRDWQSTMLPTNEFIVRSSFQVPMSGNITDIEGAWYLSSVDTTVNLFIHAMHVSQYFFRWLDPNSTPFNISALIKQSKQPDSVTSGNELNAPNYSVHASELLHLLPSNSSDDDEYNLKFFFEAARDLFNKSLSSGVNLSQADSTMTFAHGGIDRGDITYDAVTLEVPLRRNFYYRKLIMDDHGDALTEDKNATALYTDISNAANTSDIYYDLDMSVDCGPNPGACVLPRVQTYDFLGRKYQPDPQIKATAVCVNDDGSEDFKIEYNYYTVDGNASNTHLDAAWTCKRKSNTSMYIVSFGSRIEGDEMYDGRAPDSAETRPRLDAKRVTIKNPRKIYSMTVVRLEWEFIDLADNVTISCGIKDNNCDGLVYLSDRPVGGKFENNSIDDESIQPFILVGKNSVPIESLSPFLYDDTERTGTYTGFGTATRWVSLMTLATPTEDAIYSQKGDLLLSYNFRKFNRSSEKRKDRDCSASAEDYLNHVVNNHYYMDHGLQASYTAGMYFIFQNSVVHDYIVESNEISGLAFEGNTQQSSLTVVIPWKSLIVTCVGIGIILIGGICAVYVSRCGRRSLIKNLEEVDITPDIITDMMVNDLKYPRLLLDRRFETTSFNSKFRKVQIDGLVLHSGDNVPTLTLSRMGKLQTSYAPAASSASTDESRSSSKTSETNVMLDSQDPNELQDESTLCPAILASKEKDLTSPHSIHIDTEALVHATMADRIASADINAEESGSAGDSAGGETEEMVMIEIQQS